MRASHEAYIRYKTTSSEMAHRRSRAASSAPCERVGHGYVPFPAKPEVLPGLSTFFAIIRPLSRRSPKIPGSQTLHQSRGQHRRTPHSHSIASHPASARARLDHAAIQFGRLYRRTPTCPRRCHSAFQIGSFLSFRDSQATRHAAVRGAWPSPQPPPCRVQARPTAPAQPRG